MSQTEKIYGNIQKTKENYHAFFVGVETDPEENQIDGGCAMKGEYSHIVSSIANYMLNNETVMNIILDAAGLYERFSYELNPKNPDKTEN